MSIQYDEKDLDINKPRNEGIMLPMGESSWERAAPDKNKVKVVMDDEHNKLFVEEFRQKLAACNNETDVEKLKTMFKNMTGFDFDELYKEEPAPAPEEPADLPETPTETSTDSVITAPVAEEDGDNEFHHKTLEQLDYYMAHPEQLKFTDEEIKDIIKMGAFDRDTIETLAGQINDEVELIIDGFRNPASIYYSEETRLKAIKETLELKVRAQDATQAAKQFAESGAMDQVFAAKYPEYDKRGSAAMLEEFLIYLNDRTATVESKSFLYNELNNKKKLHHIIDRGNDTLFKGMLTTKNTPYTVGSFIASVMRWNIDRFAILSNIPREDVTLEKFDSLLLIFSVLFIRYWYKKITPDIQQSSLERRLFYNFIRDNAHPLTVSGEKTEWLDEAWNAVWGTVAEIANGCATALKTENV